MLIYNTQKNQNPFRFEHIIDTAADKKHIQPRAIKRATSKRKKLTKKNLIFLKSLGFQVKQN